MDATMRPVHDGYVRLVDVMGSDLTVANAARVSLDKESIELTESDRRLIRYLARMGHSSPFRHALLQWEVKAPLMVARQWFKYSVGSDHVMDAWNESCLPADQPIQLWQGEKTVAELMEDLRHPVRSVDEQGVIVANRVRRIWPVGKAEVFLLRDELGNEVRLTGNHRVQVPNGWRRVDELSVGDRIGHNGTPCYQDREWMQAQARAGKGPKAISEIAGVSDRTIWAWFVRLGLGHATDHQLWRDRAWLEDHYVTLGLSQAECAAMAGCREPTIRKMVRQFGLQQDQMARVQEHNRRHGVWGKGETAETNPAIAERGIKAGATHRGQPAYARGAAHHAWKGDAAHDPATYHDRARKLLPKGPCEICQSSNRVHVHHRDRDHTNNDLSNLIRLCESHHKILHGQRPMVAAFARLVSKESIGIQPVFDVEMCIEPNFVAGNIVVHNSRRYVTDEPEFYCPDQLSWRRAPENRKQGSSGAVVENLGAYWQETLALHQQLGRDLYEHAMRQGICTEQARLFLAAYGLYVRWRWTASLQSVAFFLAQRLDDAAQVEIQEYAAAVQELAVPCFPESLPLLVAKLRQEAGQ